MSNSSVKVISKSNDGNSAQVAFIDTNSQGRRRSETRHVRRVGSSRTFRYGKFVDNKFVEKGTVDLNF